MARSNQKITAKQEKACQVFIETGCKSTAYRAAYNVGKMKPNTIHRKAFELFEAEIVTARVEELQAEHRAAHGVTIERLTEDLERAERLAHQQGQAGAAVSAVTAIAKLHGLMIDRSKVETSNAEDMTPEQRKEELRQLDRELIRLGGRDFLVEKISNYQGILAIYDAGQFESYAAGEIQPVKH
ncbi:MAG: terminase small subunit [Alphaproteobacteria bacterium]|nr:terminase small subunit [Alphaproteobacteria bacterium]